MDVNHEHMTGGEQNKVGVHEQIVVKFERQKNESKNYHTSGRAADGRIESSFRHRNLQVVMNENWKIYGHIPQNKRDQRS